MSRLKPADPRASALEVVTALIESLPEETTEAILDRVANYACPSCKSSNTLSPDATGMCDCLDCGICYRPKVN